MKKRTGRKAGPFRKGKRWAVDILDSKNVRHRPTFATKEEAERAYNTIKAQKSAGEFFADAASATFSQALDLMLAGKRNEGLAPASIARLEAITKKHLRPDLGGRKLQEFGAERMRFVREWLEAKRDAGLSLQSMQHLRSAVKMALDFAIDEGLLGAPNPFLQFKVTVPAPLKDRQEREVLTLDEMAELMRAVLRRDDLERELTYASRMVMVALGLFAGLRNAEAAVIPWDCIDFDGRMLYVRWSWRKGKGVVPLTKTGKRGYRDIPMGPVLHAVLGTYADRLRGLGRKLEGQVLVVERADVVTSDATKEHFEMVCRKAGWLGEDGRLRHTFYALRHTAANLWRTCGIGIDQLFPLMGHSNPLTTMTRYLHTTPHFQVLRREVDALGLESSPEGIIDAIGIALARRWHEDGIDIPVSPPRSVPVRDRPRLTYDGEATGTVIDVVPTLVSAAPAAVDDAPFSLEALRRRQREKAKELEQAGWTMERIAEVIGVCRNTIYQWVRGPDEIPWLRKAPHATRADLRAQVRKMREAKPTITTTELAQALGVHPARIPTWERERGVPMKHPSVPRKFGPHEAFIRRRHAEGAKEAQIARELGLNRTGLSMFMIRIGLNDPQQNAAVLAARKARVFKEFATAKSSSAIAREHGFNKSTVIRWREEAKAQSQTPADRGTQLALDLVPDAAD